MSATFFHDTTLIYDNDKYYTLGTMNKEKFNKYKETFGDITAVVRVVNKNSDNEKAIREENYVGNISVKAISNNYANCVKVVKEQIKQCDFAIIRMHSIIGTIACREARKNHVPYMIEMVSCPRDSLWYHGGLKYKIAMPIIVLLSKLELRKSKNTIYVTERFLQHRYPTKGIYIGCSDVELEKDDSKILEERIRKIQNKKSNEVCKLGLIGSLNVNYKGHKTVIKAISKLKNKINFEVHFLGSGNKDKWIKLARKYEVENKVYFDGIIPHNQVYEWLDNMDIYLIPSDTEGLPRSLIEAMSRGCPAIGSKVGGIPELLKDDYIIKKNDYKALASKIEKVITDKEMMKKMAKENHEKSLEYQKDYLDTKRNTFYNEILKQRKEQK